MASVNFITKVCTQCPGEKPLSEFGINRFFKDNLEVICKCCRNKRQKEYCKTKEGMLVVIYNTQKKSSIKRNHPLPLYTLNEFREWALSSQTFQLLYTQWLNNQYHPDLKPSPDRLDDYKPYTFENLRWVTWLENNQKHYIDMKRGVNNKINKSVAQLKLDGSFIAEYHSIKQASRKTGVNNGHISQCCKGTRKTTGGYMWAYT